MCKFYVDSQNIPITLGLPYCRRQLPLITLSRLVLPVLKFNVNGVIYMNHVLYGFHAQRNVLKTHSYVENMMFYYMLRCDMLINIFFYLTMEVDQYIFE